MRRRTALEIAAAGALTAMGPSTAATQPFAKVERGRVLSFPRDHGAHTDFRTEWWYLTGWCESEHGLLGVQITFFRSRTRVAEAHPAALAPRQLMLGHLALADPRRGKLLHAEQSWRVTPGVAEFSTEDCAVKLGAWSMVRSGFGASEIIRIRAASSQFAVEIDLVPSAAPWLQGDGGYSAKGPSGDEASYYYSRPQLALAGRIRLDGRFAPVKGRAWFDHEWSSTLLNPAAKGWDWVGLNLFNGESLMAFRIHGTQGSTLFRSANTLAGPDEVQWEALSHWRSARTSASYPVSWRLRSQRLGELVLMPVMPDQELDARMGTGLVYWEGLVNVMRSGELVGRGYLEMTGYASQITF